MKYEYRISAKALEDIDKIWIYTLENWSLNQANHYYRLIYQEIDFIIEDKDFRCYPSRKPLRNYI